MELKGYVYRLLKEQQTRLIARPVITQPHKMVSRASFALAAYGSSPWEASSTSVGIMIMLRRNYALSTETLDIMSFHILGDGVARA